MSLKMLLTPKCIVRLLLCTLLCCFSSLALCAQEKQCLSPIALPAPTQPNIFTEEQEVFLGDAIAERIQKYYQIIEDPELNSYLRRIGERLIKHLPITRMKFQFVLVDLPDANAFVLPGGRIYVSRKLVAFAQTEDELAGVIAHELGHLVVREHAIEVTRQLKELLGVTQVTDRQDIFEKYNRLIDNFNRKGYGARDREKGQLVADQAGFYALVNAGYDPAAQARIWDRLTELKGRKGNFFSDLFGTTKPEERRLREMLNALSRLPAACRQTRADATTNDFKRWQSAVIGYADLDRSESLHGVLWRKQLSPPLRSDITHLRFSPDGKYVLAQDDAGINVLTREPFTTIFRIESPDAKPAHFTPDSQTIVIHTDNLRVERWSVVEKKMTEAHEVVLLNGCMQTKLSPDGKFLACLTSDFDLNVLDVGSGQPVIQKKDFYSQTYWQSRGLLRLLFTRDDSADLGLSLIHMGFSPDGRYFAAGYHGVTSSGSYFSENVAEVHDMTTRSRLSLPGSIKKYIAGGFTFMGNDRLVGVNLENQRKSALISFPSGEVISEFPLSPRNLIAPTRSNHLIVRPIKGYALGVMDLSTGTVFKANKQPALDIYDDVFVAELRSGELGLYRMEKNVLLGVTVLSNVTLGRLYASEVSRDMKWLALSGRTRGGVWNMTNGEAALYLRGFRGSHLTDDGFLFADFPKYEEAERNVARFNLTSGEIVPGAKIESPIARQLGPYLAVAKSAKEEAEGKPLQRSYRMYSKNVVLEMLDARTMKLIWSKHFPKEAARFWVAPAFNTGVLIWQLQDEAAKDAVKSDPVLSQRLNAMKEKEGDYYLQIIDARTGNEMGKLLIETGKGSFRLAEVVAVGDSIVVTDTQNRVMVYSLKTGELIGRAFGGFATFSPNGVLSVENERGKLALYDLATMKKVDDFGFASSVVMQRFSPDSRRLFVLTADQTAFLLDVSSAAGTAVRN